mgnify:CR=1 FL=1
MHELAVTEDILRVACEEAEKNNATKVTDIHLTIGKLSSIVDDSVQFYWDTISQGTLCEGATLHFNRPPAILQCRQCGAGYELEDILSPCPDCGSLDLQVVSGEEMQIDEIEIIKEE